MTTYDKKPKQFTGKHMLAVMALFFGVIISVNIGLAWFATSTWTGLVVSHPFAASQGYNDILAAKKAQDALNWQTSLDADSERLIFHVALKDGTPVTGLQVKAIIGRVVQENEDQTLILRETTSGYQASTKLATGLWQLDVRAIGRNEAGEEVTYNENIRFVIKPDDAS